MERKHSFFAFDFILFRINDPIFLFLAHALSLDVEYILAIAANATTWYWSIPGQGDIFVQWIEAVQSTSNPPLVHSISYASLQPEDPKFDIERFNTDMCKLGLKGTCVNPRRVLAFSENL